MTDTKKHQTANSGSPEGRVFRPTTPVETAEAVDLAFDYRGDVLLELASGEQLAGYLFNREVGGQGPVIEVFPQDSAAPRRINYRDLVAIAFTGEDTASGKSWEAWVSKKASQRKVEADRIEAEARARGHL